MNGVHGAHGPRPAECRPDFVVDGFEASNATSLDMPTIGIIGIEVYPHAVRDAAAIPSRRQPVRHYRLWTQSGRRDQGPGRRAA